MRGVSVYLEPSIYTASGTGTSVLQMSVETLARYYIRSLFVKDVTRGVNRAPFVQGGAVLAWERVGGNSSCDVLAVGPEIRAGYRFVFGNRGFFVEPSAGWLTLFGVSTESSGPSGRTDNNRTPVPAISPEIG